MWRSGLPIISFSRYWWLLWNRINLTNAFIPQRKMDPIHLQLVNIHLRHSWGLCIHCALGCLLQYMHHLSSHVSVSAQQAFIVPMCRCYHCDQRRLPASAKPSILAHICNLITWQLSFFAILQLSTAIPVNALFKSNVKSFCLHILHI